MSDPNARFQVVPVPLHAPGYCFICRSGNSEANGPFIDTGMSHEWFNEVPSNQRDGVVYICSSCVRSMADQLNMDDEDVQRKLNEARTEGYINGLIYGKKKADDLARDLSDVASSCAGSGTGYRWDLHILDPLDQAGVEGDNGDASGESTSDRQIDDDGSGERSDVIPSDSAAGELLDSLISDGAGVTPKKSK